MSGVLVNITKHYGDDGHYLDYHTRQDRYDSYADKTALFVKNVQGTMAKEYVALVQAATALHMAWGSAKLCGHCFKGELQNGQSNGCCDSCSSLSDTGCMAKTAACAVHLCHMMGRVYPKHLSVLFSDVFQALRQLQRDHALGMPYFDRGYNADLNTAWSPEQLAKLTELAAQLNAATEQLVKDNYQPDWADVLPKLGYKPKGDNALRLAVSA